MCGRKYTFRQHKLSENILGLLFNNFLKNIGRPDELDTSSLHLSSSAHDLQFFVPLLHSLAD